MNKELLLKYQFAKMIVVDEGYQEEIHWQSRLFFDDLTENKFLQEIAWVILTCGMKESIIRCRFKSISKSFFNWSSAKKISSNREKCISSALKIFNHPPKILAIINAADYLNENCFYEFKEIVRSDPITTLQIFNFIGPITAYHLAKNIGLPVAKPDRHLERIAKMENYTDVQKFCEDIAKISGDPIPVVDIVLWRFATIDKDYIKVFSTLNLEDYQQSSENENYSYQSGLSIYQ